MRQSFGLDDISLLGDIDSVQKLSDVFVLNESRLMDECRRSGHGFDVVALENELILLCGTVDTRDARLHLYSADILLAQEVTDLDHRVGHTGGHVDGKVGVNCSHLILVSFGYADDHVLDVRTDRPNGGQLFAIAEPLLHS